MYLCRSRSRSRETTCIQRCEYKVYETLASSGLRINFEKNTIMDGKMKGKRQFTGKLYCCPFSFEMLRNLPLHVAKTQIMNRAEPSERASAQHTQYDTARGHPGTTANSFKNHHIGKLYSYSLSCS